MTRDNREQYLYSEIAKGNVPDFIRQLKPITSTALIGGVSRTAVYYVTPEYLAVGSDADYFRMPMTPILAQWLADRTGCILPTRKMVDQIYTAATVKLAPSPIAPSAEMITVPVFWDHEQAVRTQRAQNSAALGALVGGHKKDVILSVITPTLASPPRVCIYGWHQLNGSPIQPRSTVHENTYADYSHGIRFVSKDVLIDGTPQTVASVLMSSTLYPLLSDEGAAFTFDPRYPAGTPPSIAGFPYPDSFPSSGRQLGWIDKFQVHTVQSFSPASPSGDGYVMIVRDTTGGIDTARLGSLTDADYAVEAHVYCRYRPELSANGYERMGVFLRDNGNGMFTGSSSQGVQGNNYALSFDSNNGRIQCMKTVAGVPSDMLPAPLFQASSAWRKMRIEALGSSLTFKVDGSTILTTTDSTHTQGQFGVGYQDVFATNSNILGTYADNFLAESLTSSVRDWALF